MQQTTQLNYYSLLGVSSDATSGEIKNAYRKLAVTLHPDTQKGLPEKEAETLFIAVKEAYETLSHPVKRSLYDSCLTNNTPNEVPTTNDEISSPVALVPNRILEFQRRAYFYFYRYHIISSVTLLFSLAVTIFFTANLVYFLNFQFILLTIPFAVVSALLCQYYYVIFLANLNGLHEQTRGAQIRVLPLWKCTALVMVFSALFVNSDPIKNSRFPDLIVTARNLSGDPLLKVPPVGKDQPVEEVSANETENINVKASTETKELTIDQNKRNRRLKSKQTTELPAQLTARGSVSKSDIFSRPADTARQDR